MLDFFEAPILAIVLFPLVIHVANRDSDAFEFGTVCIATLTLLILVSFEIWLGNVAGTYPERGCKNAKLDYEDDHREQGAVEGEPSRLWFAVIHFTFSMCQVYRR